MLAIFDIDGTICDTQNAEAGCYAQAIREVTGVELENLDWSAYPEPTSSGIVRSLLERDCSIEKKEEAVKLRFVELLKEAQPIYPQDFSCIEGAKEFLEELEKQKLCNIAIATGGFDLEAEFKLRCCGINLHAYPHATSSDTPNRRNIISLAANRAGFALSSCVYFGDASWDIKVSRELGVPLIGIGRKREIFVEQKMRYHFRDFGEMNPILDLLHKYKMEIQR